MAKMAPKLLTKFHSNRSWSAPPWAQRQCQAIRMQCRSSPVSVPNTTETRRWCAECSPQSLPFDGPTAQWAFQREDFRLADRWMKYSLKVMNCINHRSKQNKNKTKPWMYNLPSHDASAAFMWRNSSGFKSRLRPVSTGMTIDGKARVNPKSKISKFFAELARN